MSPDLLKTYLRVFREAGCMSAQVSFEGTSISVTLGPDSLESSSFGSEPTPGGWKSDTGRLDMAFAEDMSDRIPE